MGNTHPFTVSAAIRETKIDLNLRNVPRDIVGLRSSVQLPEIELFLTPDVGVGYAFNEI